MDKIVGYPIFEVGTWNEMTFTEDDIRDIANNYVELRDIQRVPLKLGHNDEQPLTDGAPALGWAENVRKVGKQIVADFVGVPTILLQAIKKNLFRAVSIELLINPERKGKRYKYVLDAVAILGADQPAVYTLPDLSAFLASRSSVFDGVGQRLAFEAIKKPAGEESSSKPRGGTMNEEDVRKMVREAVAAATEPLNVELKSLREENSDLRKKFREQEDKNLDLESENKRLKKEQDDRTKEELSRKVRASRDAATQLLERAVQSEAITPAARDAAISLFGIDDDERIVKLELTKLQDYLGADEKGEFAQKKSKSKNGGTVTKFQKKDTTHGGSDDDLPEGRTHRDVFTEVAHRVAELRGADAKLSYKDATRMVFTKDPELHREYLGTDTPEHMAAGGEE